MYSGGDELYEDPTFPADETSLVWRDYIRNDKGLDLAERVDHWARPSELVKNNPTLWGWEGVLPDGTDQGTIGDCWFLSAASALAENGKRIKELFSNDEYDSAGIFQIWFYKMGEWLPITIDDRLPIGSDGLPVAA